eukprot:scaffold38335_cov86-Phaeocystis_antarctica.AAC.1
MLVSYHPQCPTELLIQTWALGGRPDQPAGAPGIPSGRGCYLQGRGLTHALTDTAPTELTVATHSPLGGPSGRTRARSGSPMRRVQQRRCPSLWSSTKTRNVRRTTIPGLVRFKKTKTDQRVERPEAAGDGDWAVVGGVEDPLFDLQRKWLSVQLGQFWHYPGRRLCTP